MILSSDRDAQGHEIFDYFQGNREVLEIVERDDGFIEAYTGPRTYFSQYENWARYEKGRDTGG